MYNNPLAQTFFVDTTKYPYGLFLSSMNLFFQTKDDTLPVGVRLVQTKNGYPVTSSGLPFGEVWMYPNDVNVTDGITTFPDASNTSTATTFTFSSPVYLQAGYEYAFVVLTQSANYQLWTAELGQNMVNPLPAGVTSRLISSQPYIGSFFRSTNSSTWTAYQNEDLMFSLNKCVFTPNAGAYLYMNSAPQTANSTYDVFMLQSQDLNFGGNTSIQYGILTTDNSTGQLDSTRRNINSNRNYYNRNLGRKVITTNSGAANISVRLTTFSSDISPVIDLSRFGLVAVKSLINDLGISNSSIVITSGGAGYVSNGNISVTITATDGLSANGFGQIDASKGQLVNIVMDNEGYGYDMGANVTIVGGGATTNATAVVASETNPSGGNGIAKYITRRVTLADGFDAGDLRVYFDAYKPPTTEYYVYYKILNGNDPASFDSRPYFLMEQATLSTAYSSNPNDVIEYEYRPSLSSNTITYTSGGTNYNSFKYFAIKIVMASSNPVDIPYIQNLRVIALPGTV